MKVIVEGNRMSDDVIEEIAKKLDIDTSENNYVHFDHLIIEVLGS
jgi:energy-converting hydrogenase A subunit M